jgi:hypothetical protein
MMANAMAANAPGRREHRRVAARPGEPLWTTRSMAPTKIRGDFDRIGQCHGAVLKLSPVP